jgi:hypothetical protein
MTHFKTSILGILTLFLVACDRHDYVTWRCFAKESSDKKITFILDGSAMHINEQSLSFCGSLGPVSYFDAHCPSQVSEAAVNLHSKLGLLSLNKQEFQCSAL